MRWYLTARRAVVTTGAAIALSSAQAAAPNLRWSA